MTTVCEHCNFAIDGACVHEWKRRAMLRELERDQARDALQSIEQNVAMQGSALAMAIVQTCRAGLKGTSGT